MKTINTKNIAVTGLMTAMVMIFTFFKITIPLGSGNTMIHMGNVACLLSAFLLGPYRGGIAAGVGSFLFDVIDPAFAASAPFSLVFKFIMAFVCGKIAYLKNKNGEDIKMNILAACIGVICYILFHLAKSFIIKVYFLNIDYITVLMIIVKELFFSVINAIVACLIAVPLSVVIKKNLSRLR